MAVALRGSALRAKRLRVTERRVCTRTLLLARVAIVALATPWILAASAEALAALAFAEPRSATRAALLMPRSRLLPSAARLARPVTSPVHSYPRSLRNFAQYSSRFRISRSKPRSGGL